MGYKEDEQYRVMEENEIWDREYGIRVWVDGPKIGIGEEYLFVFAKNEGFPPHILNLDQSLYRLDDPYRKQFTNDDKVAVYDGANGISVRDILCEFGEDKWEAFYADFKAAKPDYIEPHLRQAEQPADSAD